MSTRSTFFHTNEADVTANSQQWSSLRDGVAAYQSLHIAQGADVASARTQQATGSWSNVRSTAKSYANAFTGAAEQQASAFSKKSGEFSEILKAGAEKASARVAIFAGEKGMSFSRSRSIGNVRNAYASAFNAKANNTQVVHRSIIPVAA